MDDSEAGGALALSGGDDRRDVMLDGEKVGEAVREPGRGWDIVARIPGAGGRTYGRRATLDAAWAEFLSQADPELRRRGARLLEVADLHARVVAQAGLDGWFELEVDPAVSPSGRLRVPRAPFERWALRGANRHLWPAWDNICPRGMKLLNDDRNHSDWIVGANLDPAAFYGLAPPPGSPAALLHEAAYEAVSDIHRRVLRFDCAVLSGSGRFTGNAWHADRHPGEAPPPGAVVVLPDASARWLDALLAAAAARSAVVVEVGGAAAHLVSVGRESDLRVVRVANARRLYPDRWAELTVDCDAGAIRIAPTY